jgi:anti-sigma regulatory factor (Ser/Thr protein kinase)
MARSAASLMVKGLSPDLHSDLLLLVSELVTNSIRHAGSGPTDSIDLVVNIDESRARVEVHDPGPGFSFALRETHPKQRSGWGFFLVEKVAQRWGVERQGESMVVWFEIDL